MRVFLSWSGEWSNGAASALRDWLPLVLQAVEPFMSSEDIEKGARWGTEISDELEACDFGIICLTPDNIASPWVHFEAGALAKSVDAARVSPLILGLKTADITGPLVQFQATLPNKTDMLRLCSSIDTACGDHAVGASRLTQIFEALWPNLDASLIEVHDQFGQASAAAPPREPDELLLELLELVRGQSRVISSLDRNILPIEAGRGRLLHVPGPQDQRAAAQSIQTFLQASGVPSARVGPGGPGNPTALRVRIGEDLPPDVLGGLESLAHELGYDVLLELRPTPPKPTHPPHPSGPGAGLN